MWCLVCVSRKKSVCMGTSSGSLCCEYRCAHCAVASTKLVGVTPWKEVDEFKDISGSSCRKWVYCNVGQF